MYDRGMDVGRGEEGHRKGARRQKLGVRMIESGEKGRVYDYVCCFFKMWDFNILGVCKYDGLID